MKAVPPTWGGGDIVIKSRTPTEKKSSFKGTVLTIPVKTLGNSGLDTQLLPTYPLHLDGLPV